MLRALRELELTGIATTVPADIAILEHEDFIGLTHSTNWVETTLDLSDVASTPAQPVEPEDGGLVRRDVDVEVGGRRYAVRLWVPEVATAPPAGAATTKRRTGAGSGVASGGSGQVTVPMQGTIVKVLVAVGDTVEVGQTVCVLEAMKMENNIAADMGGTVAEVKVGPGDAVGSGDVVAVIT
jgi:acetyl-CoA/propionyl-CoA carboxylase biotin carboxyl carrier protein